MSLIDLANRVRDLRQARSWAQAQLAEVAGVSLRTIQRLERDGHCSPETLLAIAAAFEIDVRELTAVRKQNGTGEAALRPVFLPTRVLEWADDVIALSPLGRISDRTAAVIGILAILAPLYFAAAAILKEAAGIGIFFEPLERLFYADRETLRIWNVVSPLVFLSGMFFAIVLNAAAMCRLNSASGKLEDIIASLLARKFPNIVVFSVSIMLLVGMVMYAIGENLMLRPS